MIVDTHMHCWLPEHVGEIQKQRFAAMEKAGANEERINWQLNNPPERYLALAEGVVDIGLICAFRFEKTLGLSVPNSYVAEVVNKYPNKFRGICYVDPTEGKAAVKELEVCVKEHGFVGLKVSPTYQGIYANDKLYYPIYEKAVELGIPIQFHSGFTTVSPVRLRYARVLDLDDVAIDFPELKIHILHFGYYNFEDTVNLMMKHLNVFTSVGYIGWQSGLDTHMAGANMPVVSNPYFNWLYPLSYAMSAVWGLPNKIMFETDYESITPPRAIEILKNINPMLKEHNLPPIPMWAIDNIIEENWKQVYKIKS